MKLISMRVRLTTWAGLRSLTIASIGSMGSNVADEEGHRQKVEIGCGDDHHETGDRLENGEDAPTGAPRLHLEVRHKLVVLDIAVQAATSSLLEDQQERSGVERCLLQLLVHGGTLVVVAYQKSSLRLFGHPWNVPGIAPGTHLHRVVGRVCQARL